MSEDRHSSRKNSSPRQGRSSNRSNDREERADRRDKNPETFTQIYVAKLHTKTREDDLRSKFSRFGHIREIVLKRSYAFIDFDDHDSAEAAVREMNGKTFVNGEELVVEQSGRKYIDLNLTS